MKRLFVPLLLFFVLPTDIKADTWYLLGRGAKGSTWQIPMESKQQCTNAGKKFLNPINWKGKKGLIYGYVCLKGK